MRQEHRQERRDLRKSNAPREVRKEARRERRNEKMALRREHSQERRDTRKVHREEARQLRGISCEMNCDRRRNFFDALCFVETGALLTASVFIGCANPLVGVGLAGFTVYQTTACLDLVQTNYETCKANC
jgi:hypothetical protein